MARPTVTVPVPLPTGVVNVIAPLLIAIENAVEVTADFVMLPLLLTVIWPA